jgi:hypothetical protein
MRAETMNIESVEAIFLELEETQHTSILKKDEGQRNHERTDERKKETWVEEWISGKCFHPSHGQTTPHSPAHWKPIFWNIWRPKRGKEAANMLRINWSRDNVSDWPPVPRSGRRYSLPGQRWQS